ncbi:alpha-2-macroglobulin family protein [Alloalcanivorax mobilis]|uniref:alpha-2-macroglobulin family protein n=1 Tax=Alloalcanivorax mobilis TaxID=2019569 RepID=UPI000C7673BE|nr:MG2 domain-containing protein [Alloalcanivorax mobilis]
MRSFVLGLALLTLLLSGCDPAPEPPASETQAAQPPPTEPVTRVDDRWLEHLESYPRGEVSARAPLVVRFNHPVVDQSAVGKPAKGVARLTPAPPFEAVFTAPEVLEIRPREPLPAARAIQLTLYPQAFSGIDDSLPPLQSRVAVIKQQLAVRVDALAPADDDTMVLRGRLESRDRADAGPLEKTLSAGQGERALNIEWRHDAAGLSHDFTVTGIERSDQAPPVRLRWNGEPLGVAEQGEHQYPVPAAGQFAVTTVRTVGYPQPHLQVQFSEALMGDQNTAGLVTVNGADARVRIDGSRLLVYPPAPTGDDHADGDDALTLKIAAGLRSASRARLETPYQRAFTLSLAKPGVRFVGEGSILPNGKTLSVPFEAVATRAVQVQAFEIFENNITRYLQNHSLAGDYPDTSSGRYLWQKTLTLPPDGDGDWHRYRLDLSELMARHPNGLVLLTLKVDASAINYQCPGDAPAYRAELPDDYEGPGQEEQGADRLASYYRDAGYLSWRDRDDPCADAYYAYNDRVESSRAFLASNLGLIAKRGENDHLTVIATELDSNRAAADVKVAVYNFQHQRIGDGVTNSSGETTLALSGTPFYLVARQGDDRGYLKLARNLALPTNQFNTGGERVREGLKGFFYGERDVWRPGDDIHLTFVLGDPRNRIPDDHPLTLDWFDPRGNKVASYSNDKPVGQFYAFTLKTSEDAPTGNWRAVARIGERYFDTSLRVEAIKPNHLKIDLQTADTLNSGDNPVTLHAQWLNGARAGGLKTDVKARLVTRATRFQGYDGFVFDDPTRALQAEPFTAFEGTLDNAGDARFPLTVPDITPPGMVSAFVTTRVFENSGDYSTQIRSLAVAPYQHWVGLRVPKGSGWGDSLGRDKDHEIGFLTLNGDGKPEAGRALTLSVYRIDWRWWWDQGSDNLTSFISDPHTEKLSETRLTSDAQGRAEWTLKGQDYEWGRHLLRVCEADGDHCSAQAVYLGWSGDRGAGGDAATRLALSTDKDQYQVGETARVQVPVSGAGRLLVSLENGARMLKHYWVKVPGERETLTLEVPVSADMAPNVYVHVTLLQPHSGRDNDRPIRLYGIAPLMVDDPATRLTPTLKAPAEVRPQSTLAVSVAEKQGRPMTYTLAVVDEGLLGITNFATPRPHDAFYQREALGVLTWDLFDQVVGAYGGQLDQLLALGGSDALQDGKEKQRRRFPPVVRFLGPFQLAKGETRQHQIELPAYMGQVRVMVVAGDGRAYGHADQDVTVTQPLTLLATLPRVLGPGERLDLPVTVFATTPEINTVTLTAQAQAPVSVTDGEATLTFSEPGDDIARLGLSTGDGVGSAAVTVSAAAGDHHASETVNIPVRAPNPPTTRETAKLLEAGASATLKAVPHGIAGTNRTWLTVSSLPAMGLERRLDYLMAYPHGCIEQTVSSVFPQLYLNRLVALDPGQQEQVQRNVDAGIQRLRRFQLSDGAFSYWPGSGQASDWGGSYAGHFLLEARRLGYAVPDDLIAPWLEYQRRVGQSPGQYPWEWSAQAYRLYTLALAGEPEVGAMNRLREALDAGLKDSRHGAAGYYASRWLLAAAYQQMGLVDVAGTLIQGAGDPVAYARPGPTYGSTLRDQAIELRVRDARGDSEGAWRTARAVAGQLASRQWYSTQSTAWALMAMARFAGGQDGEQGYSFAWRQGQGDWQSITSQAPLFRQALELAEQGSDIEIRNDSERRLFGTVTTVGTPAPGHEQATSQGLGLNVRFQSLDGKTLDPARLPLGTDFSATVTVTNRSGHALENLALTQVMPSGWQIGESRLAGDQQAAPLDYRDVRDDRVLSYFSLAAGESRQYTVSLNASFAGRFYLPGWQVEAMYDGAVRALSAGKWVEVSGD